MSGCILELLINRANMNAMIEDAPPKILVVYLFATEYMKTSKAICSNKEISKNVFLLNINLANFFNLFFMQ